MSISPNCAGTCRQGRFECDCRDELANGSTRPMRFDGTARETQPGAPLPQTPDPAEAASDAEAAIAFGVFALALVAFGYFLAMVVA